MLNAAIFRNPSNVSQIKSDLTDLCQYILQISNAKDQHADLVKKGKEDKSSITELRNEVKVFLETEVPQIPQNATREKLQVLNLAKIKAMQLINNTIAVKYKNIMAELSQDCENVLGKPPCEYAVVGMGSLAREEITPYSDFEPIILLFDDENYES